MIQGAAAATRSPKKMGRVLLNLYTDLVHGAERERERERERRVLKRRNGREKKKSDFCFGFGF